MKNRLFRFAAILSIVLVAFSACKDDELEINVPDNYWDSYYVFAGNLDITELTKLDIAEINKIPTAAKMIVTPNEAVKTDKSGSLFEAFFKVEDPTVGFQIVKVASNKLYYIGSTDVALVTNPDGNEPKNGLYKGTTADEKMIFKPEAAGLYHVVIDVDLHKVAYAKADWGLIGAATPGGWGGSTVLPLKESTAKKIVWEVAGVKLSAGDYKFRYSNGWKILLGEGVNANTNLGGTLDALLPGGGNIKNDSAGIYTVTLTYTLGNGYAAAAVKTGDVAPVVPVAIDYTAVKLGLIGANLKGTAETDTTGAWAQGILLSAPTVSGNTYTWIFSSVTIPADATFKIREGQDWNGKSLGFADVEITGAEKDNFKEAPTDGNFKVTTEKVYDITLSVVATTDGDTWTFDVKEHV